MKCLEQYVGSAIKLQSRFRIHKSDTKLRKVLLGLLGTLIINAVIPQNPFVDLWVQLIQKVYCIYDDCNIEDIFRDREKILTVPIIYKCKRYE